MEFRTRVYRHGSTTPLVRRPPPDARGHPPVADAGRAAAAVHDHRGVRPAAGAAGPGRALRLSRAGEGEAFGAAWATRYSVAPAPRPDVYPHRPECRTRRTSPS